MATSPSIPRVIPEMPLAKLISPRRRAVPPPRITWRGVGLAFLIWVCYSVLFAIFIAWGVQVPLDTALGSQFIADAVLALYSIPAWLLVVRAMDEVRWIWKITVHVVIAPLYAWLGFQSFLLVVSLIIGTSVAGDIGTSGLWILFSNLTIYALQFAIYHAVRSVHRLRVQERQAAALQALTQKQELAALKAQVNPHFLFNTLNSISAMVSREPEEAREMIAQLAGLLRYTLDSSRHDLVPLRDEVRFARAYLDLEQKRFSDRLEVVIDVEPEALEVPVPPVVLQPLVENAVRHGIGPSEVGGCIRLQIDVKKGLLNVCVEDTGMGLNGQTGTDKPGIGLANTAARLRHIYGSAVTFHAEPRQPVGFAVWFSIPIHGQPSGSQ